jgi:hypothetical protein
MNGFISVKSSQLAQVSYNEDTRILSIIFHNGTRYDYYDVPKDVYDSLMSSSSIGSYFTKNIKFKFKYSKV